jgi:hypothetical protein
MPRLFTAVQRAAISGTAAAAFVLSGCSESTSSPSRVSAPDAASLSQSPDLMDQTGRHVFHTKQWFENQAQQNAPGNGRGGGGSTGSTGISYHGGPVLQSGTNVAAIYWASTPIYTNGPAPGTSGSGAGDASNIGIFLRGLGGSPYFNINHSYTDGSGRAIANSVTYTQYWANNSSVPANGQSISDAQMVAMLQSGFNSSALTYEPSTVYAIFTAGTVNLGGGFGTQYCAYHYRGTVTINGVSSTVLYAAMPYNAAYQGACTVGSPANGAYDPGADYEVNTLAHEIEEATTDPRGSAWFDTRGYENADKCAWTFGTTYKTASGGDANMNLGGKDFLIQRNWVNAGSGGCALFW